MFSSHLFKKELQAVSGLIHGKQFDKNLYDADIYSAMLDFQARRELNSTKQEGRIYIDEESPYSSATHQPRYSTNCHLEHYAVSRYWNIPIPNEIINGKNYMQLYSDTHRDELIQMKLYRWCGNWYTEGHTLLSRVNPMYVILHAKEFKKLPRELLRLLVHLLNY